VVENLFVFVLLFSCCFFFVSVVSVVFVEIKLEMMKFDKMMKKKK